MERVFEELVKEYGTPLYIFQTDTFKNRIKVVAETLKSVKICYCVKANPFLVAEVSEYVSRFEVCSYGEFLLCQYHQIPPGLIFFTGVYKEESQVKEAIRYGVRRFSCESRNQLKILDGMAKSMGVCLQIFLRLGGHDQFGMSRKDIFDIVASSTEGLLHFAGIHYFASSQKQNISKIESELQKIDQFCGELRQKLEFSVEEIEYGLGLDTDYFSSDPFGSEMRLLADAAEVLSEFAQKYCITVEMGRFYTAICGYYLTKVVDTKVNEGIRYAVVDGGSHQMHYDGQMMGMKIPPVHIVNAINKEEEIENVQMQEWTLCGSLCTHNDLIARRVPLDRLKLGDILCFEYIGAYSVTEGMAMFLTRDIPPVILYSHDKGIICARPRSETVMLNGGCIEGRNGRF